ncbi:HAD family hydrolase [Melghirimyces algeriensis]|uniref:Cof subfamily of IIB subfamily of haloacid dehalogenase superfamily/HAD-superfamily hydrolase, subfamily IIB n=1 Tax=Melghirimyces algeriensis TaxID=910412 RepID=A0A521BUX5_9BACL|nr:HAD family hydrolase [Melghirimyces algeriensis]SMO50956.1 hypothetical protein SAMN06264849_102456 [Melghirimyces algeriensis]
MIEMVVCDLDGTLLDQENRVSKENREALKQAATQGMEICLASGRMQLELDKVSEELDLAVHGVSQNGSFVQTKNGEQLHQSTFSTEVALDLFDQTQESGLFTIVCFEDVLWTPDKHPYFEVVQERMFVPILVMTNIREHLKKKPPSKFSFLGEMDHCIRLKKALDRYFSEHIQTFISDKDCLDVVPSGVSKGNGLFVLTQHLGIQPDKVMCFGDAFNDISMFQRFPTYSYAMVHADEAVQNAANDTISSVAEAVKGVLNS